MIINFLNKSEIEWPLWKGGPLARCIAILALLFAGTCASPKERTDSTKMTVSGTTLVLTPYSPRDTGYGGGECSYDRLLKLYNVPPTRVRPSESHLDDECKPGLECPKLTRLAQLTKEMSEFVELTRVQKYYKRGKNDYRRLRARR